MWVPNKIAHFVTDFAKFYHEYRVVTEKLSSVRYRIVSSLPEYQKTRKLQLAFTDKPGDRLPPLSIEEIKNTLDILSGMHPVDVNSVNDLYYLSKDDIIDVSIDKNRLIAIKSNQTVCEYDLTLPLGSIHSPRLSYALAYIKAKATLEEAYQEKLKYRISNDKISSIEVEDLSSGLLEKKSPLDILFSDEYKEFSKEDVAKIAYICGQLSKTR